MASSGVASCICISFALRLVASLLCGYSGGKSNLLTYMSNCRWLSEFVILAFFCNGETWITFPDLSLISVTFFVNGTQELSVTHHVLIYLNFVGTQTRFELFGHHIKIYFHACRITKIVIGNLLVHFQHSKAIFLKGKLSLLTSNAADLNGFLLLKSDICRRYSLGRHVLELVRLLMFVYIVPCEEMDRGFYYCHRSGMNGLIIATKT